MFTANPAKANVSNVIHSIMQALEDVYQLSGLVKKPSYEYGFGVSVSSNTIAFAKLRLIKKNTRAQVCFEHISSLAFDVPMAKTIFKESERDICQHYKQLSREDKVVYAKSLAQTVAQFFGLNDSKTVVVGPTPAMGCSDSIGLTFDVTELNDKTIQALNWMFQQSRLIPHGERQSSVGFTCQ
ncbi:MAG: hypothetical protein ACI936_002037 [Paraglaciecola sp.]|jgi:hypothetical protein